MKISKYNANGNDFAIFHTFLSKNRNELAIKICDRQNGIGSDGLIVILPHENAIKWEFYNSDGTRADMCGNGSRAAFLYAYKNGLIGKSSTLLTGAGIISGTIFDDDVVEVELTNPKVLDENLNENDKTWHFYDTGVPHLVHFCKNLDDFSLDLARNLRQKYNANVNFAKVIDDKLFVRTYERGVENETFACGTGMAACFYGGVRNLGLNEQISVYPKSGEKLGLSLKNGKIFFSGAVKHTFDAVFYGE